MPHWDNEGREQWVCQKGAHVCTGESIWVERGSDLARQLGCHGNVCPPCLQRGVAPPPRSVYEHARRESGLDGQALRDYVNRYYGHG